MPKRRKGWVLVALVLLDFALKACAWAFLGQGHQSGPRLGPFLLGYVENDSGFGFDQTRLLAHYGLVADDSFIACTLLVFLLLSLMIFIWHKVEAKLWIKTVVAAAVYLAAAAGALALHDAISLSFSPYLRSVLRILGPLSIALALFVCVKTPYFTTMSVLFLAGTVGNCASLLLPPFAVIDFFGVYRRSIGSYVYANAADFFLAIAVLMMVLGPAYALARRLATRRRPPDA